MSDLFHKDVPDDFVRSIFDAMLRADWHTYRILTKRPQLLARIGQSLPWPSHIWIGVSAESNDYAWRGLLAPSPGHRPLHQCRTAARSRGRAQPRRPALGHRGW